MKIMKGRQNVHDIIRSSRISSRSIQIAATMDQQNKHEVATLGAWGGQDFRRNLPIRIGLGGRLTVDSVMLHFAIIRIHLIRRDPSGGTPWLWPFSILLGGPIF